MATQSLPTNQENLKSAVATALRHWHTVGGTDESLLSFLLLVQQERQQHDDVSPSTLRLATSNILMAALSQLEKDNEEGVRILRRRFQDREQIRAVAYELNISEFTVSHKQREAIEQLANLLAEEEAVVWQERLQAIAARLPPPSYTRLFGVAEPQALLVGKLLAEAEPWLTAVVGIGGIGKTSLARAVTGEVIRHFRFADAVWVKLESTSMSGRFTSPEQLRDTLLAAINDHLWPERAGESTPHGRLLRVRQALKQQPLLVIVDNLESAEDTANLLDYLQDLANPSKFLLTSRTRPAGAFSVSLDQLPLAAATELVRYHIQNGNIEGTEALRDEDIAAIYEHTGGNPLALIFVVKLLDALALPHILDGLKSVNIEKVAELYRHIYWQNWQTISDDARTLLQALVLVSSEGATLDYLRAICGLEDRPLKSAVTELRHRSLLEMSGDVHTWRYSIHPLTKSFLKTEIIHWPSDVKISIGPSQLDSIDPAIKSDLQNKGTSQLLESVETETLSLKLDLGIHQFTLEEQDLFIIELSHIVGIDPDDICFLDIASGSIVVKLEMPEEAAALLLSMFLSEESVLKSLPITKIELMRNPIVYELTSVQANNEIEISKKVVEQVDLPKLRIFIVRHFSISDLQDICFDMGIDYENLEGQGKGDKARELVKFVIQRGRIQELVSICRQQRPYISVSDLVK